MGFYPGIEDAVMIRMTMFDISKIAVKPVVLYLQSNETISVFEYSKIRIITL